MSEKFTARCLVAADCTAVMHEADCASIRANLRAPVITPPPMDPPHTAADCRRWQDLDARFDTEPDSPLHHNNRCTAPEHVSRSTVRHPGLLRRRSAIRPTNLPR